MYTNIGAKLYIHDASEEIEKWCKDNLELPNPDYAKKKRMNMWVGKTPKTIVLYARNGDCLELPFGCLRDVLPMLGKNINTMFSKPSQVNIEAHVPLYDYQTEAVGAMIKAKGGILCAPAGSGKTRSGIAIMCTLKRKALWITHTSDLLLQSKNAAREFVDDSLLGTITNGKVEIGSFITFATVQTLCNIDLLQYRDEWDVIIVDECHRVAGSPTSVTQFSKVLNSLRARYKFGLSATVHRADGLIMATHSLLGKVSHTVPESAVRGKIVPVTVIPVSTGVGISTEYMNPDGTTNHAKLISYLTERYDRNEVILDTLIQNNEHSNLILSDRVAHLSELFNALPEDIKQFAAVIDGKMQSKAKKSERAQAIEDMRTGKKKYLFATYSLAKEGLDIPRLDRLYLATPQKDYAVIVQSIGRIARRFDGKEQPIAYDFVDNIRSLQKAYKTRCTSYRKCGCTIERG